MVDPAPVGVSLSASAAVLLASTKYKLGDHAVATNDSKPTGFRRLTVAEFARMSTSRQLSIIVIRKAQLSSRKVSASAPKREKPCDQS